MFLSNTRALRAAERYLRRGRLAAAIARCERLVERNPRDLTAVNSLGDLYVRAGRTAEAVAVFLAMGEYFYAEGFLPRAIAILKKVIRIDPSSMEALARLAELCERVGRKAEAIEWHQRSASVLQSSTQPHNPTEIYPRISPPEASAVSLRPDVLNASEVDPVLTQAELSEDEFVIKQIFRAEVLAIRGGSDEAIAILREILSFAPDNVPARSKLKDVYLRAGLADLAANECLQLARIRESRKMQAIGYLEDELEFGMTVDDPAGEEPVQSNRSPDLVPGFEFFAKTQNTFNRRNLVRVAMSLPVLVVSDDGGWREFAETVNVSRAGALVRLGHAVNPATTLRATLPMPVRLRPAELSKGLYVIRGVVRHAVPDPGGDHLVGIEFELRQEAACESRDNLSDCNQTLTTE